MNVEKLKKGFGYQKESVYKYIAELEEEFSAKLSERENQINSENETLRERIKQLEEEIILNKKEIEEEKKQRNLISNTLVDAQAYAAKIREDLEKQRDEEQKKLTEEVERQKQIIELYKNKIDDFRRKTAELLKNFDEKAAEAGNRAEKLKDNMPSGNMSMFQKKQEQNVQES